MRTGHDEVIVGMILGGAVLYYLLVLWPLRKTHWILHDPSQDERGATHGARATAGAGGAGTALEAAATGEAGPAAVSADATEDL